ncbi:monoamine oxidase [Caenorhabditis elegans]|uniref:monoamine oxidase n=1 Tax=Caenorhabditis elegans TaxID=6239 RepID=Q9XXU5_CAEEL|nr:Amine oxidase domain-containing protein [Caenorhabditis elegans]CAA15509.3 Amine oxidase domain-containing protein [Caenorhabditis elegans]|eukprot:NP_493236.3 AMine oXidase family [Caenorhabditis elegans]
MLRGWWIFIWAAVCVYAQNTLSQQSQQQQQPTSANISSSNIQQTIYDVIVVGAGLTGLTAARNIQQNRPGLSVLVLEARGQVGGRIRYATMQTRNGVEFVDTGSQFISPTDTQLLSLIQELNVRTTQQLTCGNNTVFQQTRKKRQLSLQQQWSTTLFTDLINSPETLGNLTNTSVSAMSQQMDTADADSVNRMMQTFFDAPGEQVPEIQLALTCSSQNATAVEILRRFGHGQSLLAQGGMNEVVRRLADGLLIEYSQRVVSVNDAAFPAVVQTSAGRRFSGRQVIVAVPIPTLENIELVPAPEAPFQQLIQNYGPTGHAYYFTMSFQRATWRLNGRSGKVIYTSATGPLVWLTTFDTTFAASCDNSTSASSTLWGIAHFSYDVPFETRRKLYTQAIMYSLRFADFSPLDVSDVNFATDDLAKGTIPTLKLNIPLESLKYLNDFHTLYQNVHIATADIASHNLGTMNGAVHAAGSVSTYVLQMLSAADAQSNGVLRDTPVESTTPYVYSTSSHYPPSLFAARNVQNDSGNRNTTGNNSVNSGNTGNQTNFQYETSSQYPTTVETPTTTTMKHFSFGNLDNSTNEEPAAVAYDSPQQDAPPTLNYSTTFAYSTSSVMPLVETIETTTFKHFSNGNLDQNATSAVQRDVPAVLVNQQQNGYAYTTSTHYPVQLSSNRNRIDSRATPSPQVVQELQQVSANASNSTALQLASSLTQLVQTLLQTLRLQ